jgi:transcriptional regulator with XRE-family HTH domain
MEEKRPNYLLIFARHEKGWTQEEVAGQIEVTSSTIRRWEREGVFPEPIHLRKLVKLFGKSEQELGFFSRGTSVPLSLLSTALLPPSLETSSAEAMVAMLERLCGRLFLQNTLLTEALEERSTDRSCGSDDR